MNRGLHQTLISAGVFAIVIGALISVDEHVRERFRDLLSGGVTPWGDRASDLGGAIASAFRTQSIENAPMLLFAVAGAILFVFMVRS